MKRNPLLTATLVLLAFALFVTAAPSAMAAECTLKTAKGYWAFTYTGSVINPANGTLVPAAQIGVISFDGAGNAAGTDTFAAGGGPAMPQTFKGTYTENSDCSGTFPLVVMPGGQTVTGSWVASSEDHSYLIFTSPGFAMSGSTSRVTK